MRLLTTFLLFLTFALSGQTFRAIQPVEPQTIAVNADKYTTLVQKRLLSGATRYYFVTSDSAGNIPPVAFRYGNVFTDLGDVTLPTNFVSYFNCNFTDGLVLGSFALNTGETRVVNLRRFNDAWWVTQVVDGTPSIDMFQPRGINFLGRGDVTVTYQAVFQPTCYSQIASDSTDLDGLFLTPNFTKPDGYVYDSVQQVYQKEGTIILPEDTTQIAVNNNIYVFPQQGTESYFNPNTNVYETDKRLMQLQLTESGGNYTLRDLSTFYNRNVSGEYSYSAKKYKVSTMIEHEGNVYLCIYDDGTNNNTPAPPNATYWQQKNVEKRYFISFNTSATEGYTAAQMQTGINVNGWKGKEITVFMGYFPTTGELSYMTPTSQQIYIPGGEWQETLSGGTYYNRHPSQNIIEGDRVFRWNQYIQYDFNIPSNKDVIIDAINEVENSQKTTYGSRGVYSRVSETSGRKYLYAGDDWLTDIGHPKAYAGGDFNGWWETFKAGSGGLAAATNEIKGVFQNRITKRATDGGYSYIMLNNELWSYWNDEFRNVIKQCYDQHRAVSNIVLSAWTDNLVATEFSIEGQRTRAYEDYIDARSYDQFAADNTRFFSLTPKSSHKYSLDVAQTGFYFTDRNPHNLAKLIAQSLFLRKYDDITQKIIPTIWNNVETLNQPLMYSQEYFNGVPILSRTKAMVSPHLMRNYGAASAFFGDGVHMWHNGYTVANEATNYYEAAFYNNEGAGFLINMDDGSLIPTNPLNFAITKPYTKETNVDWLINGVWAVYKNTAFADLKAKVADVSLDNGASWRTGENAFVIGAAIDKAPFAAFKRSNNEFLVFAVDFNGTTEQWIKVRMDGIVKDVLLRADNVSIVKF